MKLLINKGLKMKKLLLSIGLILVLTSFAFADASDITKVEVRPDVAKYALDTVKFLIFTKTCEVTYRKLDSDGNSLGEEIIVRFIDVPDNPETEENESVTEFTKLLTAINNGSNIKQTITNAVKIKLEID